MIQIKLIFKYSIASEFRTIFAKSFYQCYSYKFTVAFLMESKEILKEDNRVAKDIYGQSKYISELILKKSLIIRTSTIGHEIFYKRVYLSGF